MIDVGEIDSVDEVLVATAVKEEDSNIWVSNDERSVEVVGGSGGSKRKTKKTMSLSKLQLHTMSYQVLLGNMYKVTLFVNKLYFVCFMNKDYTEVGSFLYEFKGFNFFFLSKKAF